MDQDDLLLEVSQVLERLHIPYFVTGSIATIFYGEPRFTNDIDVVVLLEGSTASRLVDEFSSDDYYLSREAALDAVTNRSQFNLIHPSSGLKVDFMVAEESAFNRSRFARARKVRAKEGLDVEFASPEDVILMKLEYYRRGKSEKHLRDIAGVLAVSGDDLDREYIAEWVARLGLEEVWAALDEREAPLNEP